MQSTSKFKTKSKLPISDLAHFYNGRTDLVAEWEFRPSSLLLLLFLHLKRSAHLLKALLRKRISHESLPHYYLAINTHRHKRLPNSLVPKNSFPTDPFSILK